MDQWRLLSDSRCSRLGLSLMSDTPISQMVDPSYASRDTTVTAYESCEGLFSRGTNNTDNLSFAINFGDIVDGFCRYMLVAEFEKFYGPVYHMIGNHCLYNLPREELLPTLRIKGRRGLAYYEFSPTPGYGFGVLDAYDVSAIAWPRDNPNALKAMAFLEEKNPNADKDRSNGLVGLDRRLLLFNGAVGREQLDWLDAVLQDASNSEQKVIICCHILLDPGASSDDALLWNCDEVMDVIHGYKRVKACLAGHDHKGGYSVDSYGVHHRVNEAALECPSRTDAFGYIDVYDDRISLAGTGQMQSNEMVFGT